jgi:hypothetical protein
VTVLMIGTRFRRGSKKSIDAVSLSAYGVISGPCPGMSPTVNTWAITPCWPLRPRRQPCRVVRRDDAGDRDIGAELLDQAGEIIGGELDERRISGAVGFLHEPPAVEDDLQAVGQGDRPTDVSGGYLADALADEQVGLDPERSPALGQRHLQAVEQRLGPLVVEDRLAGPEDVDE